MTTSSEIDYDQLAKALLQNLPAGTRTHTPTPTDIAMQQMGWPFQEGANGSKPLAPGGWTYPDVPFGPGMPIRPYPINPPEDNGRPLPRRYELPVSWNLPGATDREVPWTVLRRLAEVSLVRRCIEIRKAEMISLDWNFGVTASAVQQVMLRSQSPTDRNLARKAIQGDQNALADMKNSRTSQRIEATIREQNAEAIIRLTDWWKMPDPINEWNFADWLGASLEEHFVLDALTFFPHMNRGGGLHALEVISGDTIKPLLDPRGAKPQPPNPAYQQILQGFPRGEFTASTDASHEFDRDSLLYHPRFRRANSPYGLSNVEQALIDVDVFMRRQEWIRSEYTSGVVPEMFLTTDIPMTPETLLAYERILNDALSGLTNERHRAKVLPQGFTPVFPLNFNERYRPELDLFLIRIIALNFDIMPSELGFPPSSGLGGAGFGEAEENITYRKATRPTSKWLSSIIDQVSSRWLDMPPVLTFNFLGLESEDEKLATEMDAERFKSGATTVNEMRDRIGLPRFNLDEADIPFIVTGRDVVPLEGAVARANVVLNPPAPAGAPAGGGAARKPGQKPSQDAPNPGAGSNRGRAPGSATSVTLNNARNNKSTEFDAFRMFVRNRRRNPDRPQRVFDFEHHPDHLAKAANNLLAAGQFDAALAVLELDIVA